jgi:hypothetical protein
MLADDLRFLVEKSWGEFGPHVRRGLDVVDPVSHFMTDVVSPSLQGFQLLLGGVGHGRESLAHGVDDAVMSAGRFRTSKCGETAALAHSSESSKALPFMSPLMGFGSLRALKGGAFFRPLLRVDLIWLCA